MTRKCKLQEGLRLLDGERELKIADMNAKAGIVLEWIDTGRHLVLDAEEIQRKILSGKLKVRVERDDATRPVGPLDLLTDKAKAEFERRCAYVSALHVAAGKKSVSGVIAAVIAEVAISINDPEPPKRSTLAGWYQLWTKRGRENTSLVPNYRARGRKKWAITPEARDIIDEQLHKYYLNKQGRTLKSVIEEGITKALIAENESREGSEKIHIAGKSTLYKYVQSLDGYTVDASRNGRQAADAKYRYIGPGYKAEAPLELVYIDFQNMKVRPKLSDRGCMIRPWLLAAIDCYSRVVWAFHMSLDSPSYEIVATGLRNGLLGYDAILEVMPSVESSYPVCGYPQTLIPDREKAFWNGSYDKMCLDLGIDTTYPPPRTPTSKALVERFFGTVDRCFIPTLPGDYIVERRPDGREIKIKNTSLSFEELREDFVRWFVDDYSRNWHSTLEDYPIKKWQEGVRRFPVDLPLDPEAIKIQLGYYETSTLSKNGIWFSCELYNCPEVQEIRHRNKGKSLMVDYKIDPSDLGFIYVHDDVAGRYIRVPCTKTDRHGLDLWTHKQIRVDTNKRRRQGKAQRNTGQSIQAASDARYAKQSPYRRKRDRTLARLDRATNVQMARDRKGVRPNNALALDADKQEALRRLGSPSQQKGD